MPKTKKLNLCDYSGYSCSCDGFKASKGKKTLCVCGHHKSDHGNESPPNGFESTPNGFDPRWVAAINTVLDDRDSPVRIEDIDDVIWDRFIGPMIDEIEDMDSEEEGEDEDA